jgi:hypothetical protein
MTCTIEGNNSMGSFLEPLLKKVSRSGLKNIMLAKSPSVIFISIFLGSTSCDFQYVRSSDYVAIPSQDLGAF